MQSFDEVLRGVDGDPARARHRVRGDLDGREGVGLEQLAELDHAGAPGVTLARNTITRNVIAAAAHAAASQGLSGSLDVIGSGRSNGWTQSRRGSRVSNRGRR
jgi:hypothetical protein